MKLLADARVGAPCNRLLEACFASGTLLRTPGGLQAIESLRVGERVLSRDEHDPRGGPDYKVVEEVFERLGMVWHLTASGRLIRTTGEHPFCELGKGWTPCRALNVGDRLLCEDGTTVVVEEVVDTGAVEVVYNLRVADWHTYFVGGEQWGFSVWAHNEYNLTEDEQKEYQAKLVNAKQRIVLAKNETYVITVGKHKAEYKTNDKGQIAEVKFDITSHRHNDRQADSHRTANIGNLGNKDDVGFHLVGDEFFGSDLYPNVVPGSGDLNEFNSGAFGKLEYLWKTAVDNKKHVTDVVIKLDYSKNNLLRPTQFTVAFTVGGKRFEVVLPNRKGVKLDKDVLEEITTAVSAPEGK